MIITESVAQLLANASERAETIQRVSSNAMQICSALQMPLPSADTQPGSGLIVLFTETKVVCSIGSVPLGLALRLGSIPVLVLHSLLLGVIITIFQRVNTVHSTPRINLSSSL